MADTTRAKLITIIASSELQGRLEHDLLRLGASGYSISKVDGHGRGGPRRRGMFDIGNIRLETIVAIDKANAILEHLSEMAESAEMVAFCQDVEALPRKHFV